MSYSEDEVADYVDNEGRHPDVGSGKGMIYRKKNRKSRKSRKKNRKSRKSRKKNRKSRKSRKKNRKSRKSRKRNTQYGGSAGSERAGAGVGSGKPPLITTNPLQLREGEQKWFGSVSWPQLPTKLGGPIKDWWEAKTIPEANEPE
jgi:hypothetical protein